MFIEHSAVPTWRVLATRGEGATCIRVIEARGRQSQIRPLGFDPSNYTYRLGRRARSRVGRAPAKKRGSLHFSVAPP